MKSIRWSTTLLGVSFLLFGVLARADNVRTDVLAYVPCVTHFGNLSCDSSAVLSKVNWWLSSLEAFAASPDGDAFRQETLSIVLIFDKQGSGGRLVAESSDGYEHVLVSFPHATAKVDEIKEMLAEQQHVEVNTFGYFRDPRNFKAELLASEYPDASPVILASKSPPHRIEWKFGDFSKPGRLVVALAARQGNIVAWNELPTTRRKSQ